MYMDVKSYQVMLVVLFTAYLLVDDTDFRCIWVAVDGQYLWKIWYLLTKTLAAVQLCFPMEEDTEPWNYWMAYKHHQLCTSCQHTTKNSRDLVGVNQEAQRTFRGSWSMRARKHACGNILRVLISQLEPYLQIMLKLCSAKTWHYTVLYRSDIVIHPRRGRLYRLTEHAKSFKTIHKSVLLWIKIKVHIQYR